MVPADAPSPRRVFYYHSTDETLLDQSNDTNGSVTPADKSRPNMPLLMAVRKDQYKLHLYTRGAHVLAVTERGQVCGDGPYTPPLLLASPLASPLASRLSPRLASHVTPLGNFALPPP